LAHDATNTTFFFARRTGQFDGDRPKRVLVKIIGE
jgi:hypothetical protein